MRSTVEHTLGYLPVPDTHPYETWMKSEEELRHVLRPLSFSLNGCTAFVPEDFYGTDLLYKVRSNVFPARSVLHREDGPACIRHGGVMSYWNFGIRHRIGGPSNISVTVENDELKIVQAAWHYKGKAYDEHEYYFLMKMYHPYIEIDESIYQLNDLEIDILKKGTESAAHVGADHLEDLFNKNIFMRHRVT